MSLFKRNLLIGYGISLLLLIVSVSASYISIRNLLYNQEWVNHTNVVINRLEEVISVLKDAETGQRGYMLTGDPEFLEPYNGSLDKANRIIDDVKNLTGDNPVQQQSIEQLREVVTKRIARLQDKIDAKRVGKSFSAEQLKEGKSYMDEARKIVGLMQGRERFLLASRTENMNKFASSTPLLMLVVSVMAILVTVVSFVRVNKDFDNKNRLQKRLQQKDEETTNRLNIIRGIAERVSSGDYKTRISDESGDILGSLSFSLNKMAESLDYSFTHLSDKEWLQTGVAQLNKIMIGEKNLEILTYHIIDFITGYTQSQLGAFYLAIDDQTLELSASIALNKKALRNKIQLGEGLAGQSALSAKEIFLHHVSDTEMLIDFSAGSLKPTSIIAIPVFYETKLKGVIELASLKEYTNTTHDFLKATIFNIGMALHSARDHQRLQNLLAETQAQSEELQSQHSELENINAELEAQSERLQSSEEELRAQQEELKQVNQELEERSRLLEEKNELILERNLTIQKKAEELELSSRYKSEFLANMSHELRTPLNSILLLSRLLAENQADNLSKDQVDYATVIQASGKGLLKLIDEILDLSKIESGKMEAEYTAVKPEDFANEIRALFEPLAKEKELGFSVQVEKDTPGTIETDKLKLEQIIRNLISNALKFTRKGSVTCRISAKGTALLFSVKDTGIGIPADKQQSIFEAFRQADGSTHRLYGGTGLGLSISREMAKLLGGEIRLVSEEGKGSEFTLLLPLQKGQVLSGKKEGIITDSPVTKGKEDEKLQPEEPVEAKYLSGVIPVPLPDDRDNIEKKDKVILIIEDDTAFARSLLDYTRQKGYKGVVAVRGDEGMELAKKFLPLGILLDIQLPVKSGWEVMDTLKSDPVTRPIPVHVISSYQVRIRSLSKGAVDFINKPVTFEKLGEIFRKIEKALSSHPKKVLIIEENARHAQALAYFLESYQINAEIKNSADEGIKTLNANVADCVILDIGISTQQSYEILEEVKKSPGLENIPVIVFTRTNLSQTEEIKQYADSIVIKTAHSYERILDEVSLFLHLVEENKKNGQKFRSGRLGELSEVLTNKTILVVDDDVRNIFSLTKTLESYGMNVISAIDGKDALTQLQENDKTDLILMDMMMPEMDGYESTRAIRGISKYQHLPIIAVTAKAMAGDREKCINAGASDYITKPVDIDQLISLLRVWLYEVNK